MTNPLAVVRARRGAILVAAGLAASGAVPTAAHAVAVDLGTAAPFAVLGGSAVTNTGTSVLNGDLGVSPTSAISGFDQAVVNGATHDDDAVAAQAQSDLTAAYDVAAAEAPTLDLTGQDLGGMTLTPGNYSFSSSAQLTGQLTLDALGDPDAQFVFMIGTTLTTASNSSVLLIGQATPCNVYWQVGSSATLGTTTAFQGTIMAMQSITATTSATVQGRLLARTAAVTLDDNVIDASMCAPPTSTPPATTPGTSTPTGTTPAGPVAGTPGAPATLAAPRPGAKRPPASRTTLLTRKGVATLTRTPARTRTTTTARARCTAGFTASVRGRLIERVVFTRRGKRIASRTGSPFSVYVPAGGKGSIKARITFKDATRAVTRTLAYRACAAVALKPRPGPSQFTG